MLWCSTEVDSVGESRGYLWGIPHGDDAVEWRCAVESGDDESKVKVQRVVLCQVRRGQSWADYNSYYMARRSSPITTRAQRSASEQAPVGNAEAKAAIEGATQRQRGSE